MTAINALIDVCKARGIDLFVRDGRLGAKPRALLNAELEAEISEHKEGLIAALSTERTNHHPEIWANAYTPRGELIRVKCDNEKHKQWVEAMSPPLTRAEHGWVGRG